MSKSSDWSNCSIEEIFNAHADNVETSQRIYQIEKEKEEVHDAENLVYSLVDYKVLYEKCQRNKRKIFKKE